MTRPALGRIQRIDPREYWRNEASEFTPWLAEPDNMALLASELSIELEVVAQEQSVGPFRADILCKDNNTGHYVLIENQIEPTDHTHLGQLLTYAAGLDAVTIIWVAKKFCEEHRAALDWLNRVTIDTINFFGVEVLLKRIGDSPLAPEFSVVSKPNNWSKSVSPAGSALSDYNQIQLEFWSMFKSYMERSSRIRCANPYPKNWINHPIGGNGIQLISVMSKYNSNSQSYSQGELRVEFIIHGPNYREDFHQLETHRREIEAAAKLPLIWDSREDATEWRVYTRSDADVLDRNNWPSQHKWLKEQLEIFHTVFVEKRSVLS